MRTDMAKVIVERPRRGGNHSRKRRMGSFELLPTKEGMRQRWTDHKSLNENLAPLRRFLASRVGRRWDAVYAELNEHLAVRNAVQQHVRTHVSNYVALHLQVMADGTLADEGRWRFGLHFGWRHSYDLYVDPRDGILKRSRTDKVYRREAQQRHQKRLAKQAQAEQIVLGPYRELHRLNGVWYEIEFARLASAVFSSEGTTSHSNQRCEVYDVLRRTTVTGGERYATTKRQLTTQELRQYGVQNLLE
jgi:hypothetical protein